ARFEALDHDPPRRVLDQRAVKVWRFESLARIDRRRRERPDPAGGPRRRVFLRRRAERRGEQSCDEEQCKPSGRRRHRLKTVYGLIELFGEGWRNSEPRATRKTVTGFCAPPLLVARSSRLSRRRICVGGPAARKSTLMFPSQAFAVERALVPSLTPA